jgi:hypothetical protein
VSSLDPERSGAIIRFAPGGLGVIEARLSGQQVLRTGGAREEDAFGLNHALLTRAGDVPVVMRADDASFDPAPFGILACACLKPVEEPHFGPGLSAVGVIGCGAGGLTDVSFIVEQDHNTTPGDLNNGGPEDGLPDDPNCDAVLNLGYGLTSAACLEGFDDACSAARNLHSGVCNSPQVFTFTGAQAGRGGSLLQTNTAFSLLQDGGACDTTIAGMSTCPHADYGPDCVPCTSDDTVARAIINNPVTSGTAAAIIYDAGNRTDDVNMSAAGPGEPADCEAMLSDPNAPYQGVLVSAFVRLDEENIGDFATSTWLVLE